MERVEEEEKGGDQKNRSRKGFRVGLNEHLQSIFQFPSRNIPKSATCKVRGKRFNQYWALSFGAVSISTSFSFGTPYKITCAALPLYDFMPPKSTTKADRNFRYFTVLYMPQALGSGVVFYPLQQVSANCMELDCGWCGIYPLFETPRKYDLGRTRYH